MLAKESWWKKPEWLFFALAFFAAAPFFLQHKVFIASTDNYFHMLPNLFFSHQSLRQGSLGLWNPLILGGIDFSSSSHNHIYNPLNWPLFLLPIKWFHYGLTFRVFCEFFLVGWLAYLFLLAETRNPHWARFGGILYQLGGFTLFACTTYPTLQLQFLIPGAAYWFWTASTRSFVRQIWGFIGLASLILLSMNITYVVATLITLLILFIYRSAQVRSARALIMALGGFIIALGLCSWRLLPIVNNLLFEGVRLGHAGVQLESWRAYLLAQTAIAESFGIHLRESLPHFLAMGDGGHAQFHGMPYMSVIAVALIFFLVFKVRRQVFWSSWALLSAAWFLVIPPVSGVMDFLFFPFLHPILSKMMIPLVWTTAATYGGMYLQEQLQSKREEFIKVLLGVLAGALLLFIVPWYLRYQLNLSRLIWPILFAGLFLATYRFSQRGLFVILNVFTLVIVIGSYSHSFLQLLGIQDMLIINVSLQYIRYTMISVLILLWILNFTSPEKRTVLLTGLVLGVALLAKMSTPMLVSSSLRETLLVASFGSARTVLMVGALIMVLRWAGSKFTLHNLSLIFCVVLLLDLMPAFRSLSRQVSSLFQSTENVYPGSPRTIVPATQKTLDSELDLKNYRVNNAAVVFAISPSSMETNIPLLWGARMASGLNSDIPQRLIQLVQAFEPQINTNSYLPTKLSNAKLLDILGIGYTQDVPGPVEKRPQAMSRLMFFSRFSEVTSDALALKEMKDERWHPQQSIWIQSAAAVNHLTGTSSQLAESQLAESQLVESQLVESQLVESQSAGSANSQNAEVLNYENINNEHVRVDFEAPNTGFVYFGDGYHRDWQAKVNGVPTAIWIANASAMAVPIAKAGPTLVELEFKPRLFNFGLRCSGVVLLVCLLATLSLVVFRKTAN